MMAHPLLDENRMLRQRLDDAQFELRELKRGDDPGIARLSRAFRLTGTQARILLHLATGATMSSDMLQVRCCNPYTSGSVVKIHILSIRRAIAPRRIHTIWSLGYSVKGDDLKAIQAIARGAA